MTPEGFSRDRLGVPAVTAAEMRAIDRFTIERHGTPSAELMERAGAGAAEILLERFGPGLGAGVVIVAGKGNNGGDALVVARLLKEKGIRCEVFLAAGRKDLAGDAKTNLERLERAGGRLRELETLGLEALAAALGRGGVAVDGLFGTGLRGPLAERSLAIIDTLNAAPCPILAIDVPSGLDADRGVPLGGAVQATVTATFAFPKLGLLLHPGAALAGEVVLVDIGVAREAVTEVSPRQRLLDPGSVAAAFPPRAPETHKGTYGHVLVIAGSRGKTGAGLLAARAALRAGAGLVTLASPSPDLASAVALSPELMTEHLGPEFSSAGEPELLRLLDGKDGIVFGPGLGVSVDTRALTEWLIGSSPRPLVIDADGLNCLAGQIGWLRRKRSPIVLTPHPGEMARLVSRSRDEVQADRVEAARALAVEYGVVVVLKGARTVVAAPDALVAVNPTGNPGMASGGMGDALAGMIGSALGQGLSPGDAARAAVFWHGFAADRAALRGGEAGLLAGDVIEELPSALRALQDWFYANDARAAEPLPGRNRPARRKPRPPAPRR